MRLRLLPGRLNTTLHRSALPEGRASRMLNCSTARGIWERDTRYRRVQEPPEATITGEACSGLLAPDSASSMARSGSTVAWTSPGNAIPPDGTFATAAMGVGAKTQALTITDFASTGLTSGLVLTRLRLQVLARATSTGDAPVEVVDDLVQLTIDGAPVGGNSATLTALPSTAAVREYEMDPDALGITAAMIVANRIGAVVGYKATPETGYDTEDFSITYAAEGQGFEEDSNSPDNTIPWSLATPETAPDFQIQSIDSAEEGGFNHATQNGTVTVRVTRDAGTTTRVVVEIHSMAQGVGDEQPTNTGSANNGMGDASTAVYTLLGDTYMGEKSEGTHKVWIDLADHSGDVYGERELTLSADGHHTYPPGGGMADPSATAEIEVTATVSEPDSATVGVDSVQLIACYEVQVSTTTDPQGIGIGRYAGAIDVGAVIGGGVFDVAGADTQGAMGDDWRGERSGGQREAGWWCVWPFAQWLFYAHPVDGVYRRTIGQDDWEPLYKDAQSPGNTGDATATSVAPPYDEHQVFDPATDLPATEASLTTGGDGLDADGVIDADTGLFIIETNDWITGPYRNNWIEFEITLGTVRDLSAAMGLGFQIESLTTEGLAGGNDGFNDRAADNFVTLTNASATAATVSTRVYGKLNQKIGTYFGWIDLTGVSSAILDEVKKIKVRFGVYQTGRGNYRLSKLYAGGTFYHDDAGELYEQNETEVDELEYAYDYSEGSNLRTARKLIVVPKTHLGGARQFVGTYPYLGSVQSIRVPRADSPYTDAGTINLYRKVGDDYQRIATGPNDEALVFEDRLPDSVIAGDTTTYPVTVMDFTEATPSLSGVATGVVFGCAWKGSNCYAVDDGTVVFSRTGDPSENLWEDVVLTNDTGSEDLGPPRTSTVADDTTSPVVAMVPAENLYCFTRTECYVFVSGETAATASFPRKIDGVRGCLGSRAACQFGDKALVGCDDGLWAVKKSTTYGEQPDELIEMTKEIRASWRSLLGDSPSTVVVRHLLGEIWIFNENRYLHLTRDGLAIEGEWADGATVYDAASDPEFGLVLLLGSGHLGLIADCPTDGGTTLLGDDGEPFRWEWASAGVEGAMDPKRAVLSVETDAEAADVRIEADFLDGASVVTVTSATVANKPFRRLPAPGERMGGGRGIFTLSGGPRDRVLAAEIDGEARDVPRTG